jgi:hypothetical protein
MQNYMHNLAVRMSKPLRIRIGGNGMDGYVLYYCLIHLKLSGHSRSTYFPNMTAVLEQAEEDPYFNDIPVNFGPAFFDLLNKMANKAGEMQFFIGLSMRTPDNFTNVQALALAARQKLGKRLDALFLGNEPDLYAGHGERGAYNISAYVRFITFFARMSFDLSSIRCQKLVRFSTR